jgi:XTP/dITP diphosphohydrolase
MGLRHRDRLVVATTNPGKLEELTALLAGLPLEVRAVSEVLPDLPAVVEDGSGFAENAVKKARAVARATLMLSLADDSGLEVDLLDGRPGVRSARFAHERASDAENNAALLAALDAARSASGDPVADGFGVDGTSPASPGSGRDHGALRARFRCVLALVDPFTGGGEPRVVEGVCEGAITRTPRGSGGFGYDPLFVVSGTDKTMAELDAETKNRVSHRAAAFAALRPELERVLRERAEQIARLG